MKFKLKNNNIEKILFGNVFSKKELPNVLFYDYDGTLLYSYTKKDFLNLSSLPATPNRTNENLTCDGWNWGLEDIKSQLNIVGGIVNVGAIYHTTDNKTHITCKPTIKYPQAKICLIPTVANSVTVDWGDGTTDTWTTASQDIKSHAYTGVTDSSVYDITISCSSGTYSFETYITGSNTSKYFIYTDIKLSNSVTNLGSYCFHYCYYLQSITIPMSVTSTGSYCFQHCFSLKSLNIPSSVTSMASYCFYFLYGLRILSIPNITNAFGAHFLHGCNSLQFVTIPNGVEAIGDSCFSNCSGLRLAILPNTVKSLGSNCLYACNSLQFANIPIGVTSMANSNSCFGGCYSLRSLVVPKNVTEFKGLVSYSTVIEKLYMKPTTPPTISGTSVISNNANLVIYVPRGSLSAYQNATNWSSFSSKMVEYDY